MVRMMKRAPAFGVAALAMAVGVWLLAAGNQPANDFPFPTVTETQRIEQAPVSPSAAPQAIRRLAESAGPDSGSGSKVEAASNQKPGTSDIKPVAMVMRSGDSGKGTVYFAGLLDDFVKKAKLSQSQYEQVAKILYDAQLNWRTTWQTPNHEIVHERARPDREKIFAESRKAIVADAYARVSKILTEEQLELYGDLKGMEPEIADSLNFLAEGGKVLPSP
jgi:hypothetical protein